ncbi:uncharacterized protein [Linepithema humile]|uniref:uncharacterized protein isoform X5 n=1 Tax=Linepithema humile TaxID=83485 RepID=UPI00351EEC48
MDTRLHKYYRASGYGLNSLIYRFLIADHNLRHFFNLNAYCGAVTFITFIFAVIMVICSIASLNTMTSNDTLFRELLEKAEKKLPRIESVVSIIPPYKCIHKHLQRMSVFQEKTKKMEQSEWRRSRSPKVYHRPIIAEMSK